MPTTPPDKLNIMASNRNCRSTSPREAPTAIRIPISRVLSVTVTSMMFMIPIPEMIRAMAEMRIRTMVSTSAMFLAASRMAVRFSTR